MGTRLLRCLLRWSAMIVIGPHDELSRSDVFRLYVCGTRKQDSILRCAAGKPNASPIEGNQMSPVTGSRSRSPLGQGSSGQGKSLARYQSVRVGREDGKRKAPALECQPSHAPPSGSGTGSRLRGGLGAIAGDEERQELPSTSSSERLKHSGLKAACGSLNRSWRPLFRRCAPIRVRVSSKIGTSARRPRAPHRGKQKACQTGTQVKQKGNAT